MRPLPFDNRQGACFEMIIDKSSQKPEMLFQCHDHAEMLKFLEIFLFLLVKDREKQTQIDSSISHQESS